MLIIKVLINTHQIDKIYIHRIEGDIGLPCKYRIVHPEGYESNIISHHYNDGWMSLLQKALNIITGSELKKGN